LTNGVHGRPRSGVPYTTLSCSVPPSRSFSGENAETEIHRRIGKEMSS
jgi:hypothetical protein